jgi:ferritin-like metal-binding protein YciE
MVHVVYRVNEGGELQGCAFGHAATPVRAPGAAGLAHGHGLAQVLLALNTSMGSPVQEDIQMASLDSLSALMEEELKDLYDAEKQLTKALPKLAKKASSPELKEAFEEHLRQTEQHIERLDEVFEKLELPARGKKCTGMQNLIKEGDEMIAEAEDDATRDALMIAAAQKVEHYEIASYGTVRTWANLLGESDAAELLQNILDEEKETDQKLTSIAESSVNQEAAEGHASEAAGTSGSRGGRSASRLGAAGRSPRHHAADMRGRTGGRGGTRRR